MRVAARPRPRHQPGGEPHRNHVDHRERRLLHLALDLEGGEFVGYDAGGNPSLMSIAGNAAAGSEIDYTVAYSSVKGLRLK